MGNLPSVLAILLCDTIIIEQGTGKKTLVGLFEALNAGGFPTVQRIGFYARLTDLEGKYRFSVRVVRIDGQKEEFVAGAEVDFTADNRLGILELALNLPPLPFPNPGRYEFQLFADDVYLGRATIDATEKAS
jgi:hypothetical protein